MDKAFYYKMKCKECDAIFNSETNDVCQCERKTNNVKVLFKSTFTGSRAHDVPAPEEASPALVDAFAIGKRKLSNDWRNFMNKIRGAHKDSPMRSYD